MGAKTNDFKNDLTGVNKNFLSVEKIKLTITHLWVDGFGWENTILIEEDFLLIYETGSKDNICVGLDKISHNYVILKIL